MDAATAPSGSGATTIDRQRTARPGQVDQPPDAWLAQRVGQGALGGGGQDHGGHGHGGECSGRRRARDAGFHGTIAGPTTGDPSTRAQRHHCSHRDPRRPAQRRHRRPRRSRQDHARRCDAPPDRCLPLQPGRGRPGHGLGRSRAREGDHDPGQADDGRSRRRPPQHRRHARPRRLRRRGRALAADGRFGPAPGRRRRGPAAADPLRAPEGDGPPAAGRAWRSTRSTAATPARPRCSTRSTSCSWTSARTSTRSSSRSCTRTPRLGTATRDPAVPGTDLRPLLDLLVEVTPPVTYTPGHPAPAPGDQPVRQRLRRPDGGRADLERRDPHGPADRGRPRRGGRRDRRRRARSHGHAQRHGHQPPDRPRHRARRHRARPVPATSSASPACPRSRSATP